MAEWAFVLTKTTVEDRPDGLKEVRDPVSDWVDANLRGAQCRFINPPMFVGTDGFGKPEKDVVLIAIRAPDGADLSPLQTLDSARVHMLADPDQFEQITDPSALKGQEMADDVRTRALDNMNSTFGVPKSVFDGLTTHGEHLIAIGRYINSRFSGWKDL